MLKFIPSLGWCVGAGLRAGCRHDAIGRESAGPQAGRRFRRADGRRKRRRSAGQKPAMPRSSSADRAGLSAKARSWSNARA